MYPTAKHKRTNYFEWISAKVGNLRLALTTRIHTVHIAANNSSIAAATTSTLIYSVSTP